jgi:hypothetical protein
MASIPLDLQKRCEQRWAARFSRPDPTAPQKLGPESQQQQIKPDRGKNGSSRRASGLHQRSERGTEAPRPAQDPAQDFEIRSGWD